MKHIKSKELAIADAVKKDMQAEKTFHAMIFCLYVYDQIFYTNHLKNVKAIYLQHRDASLIKLSFILNTEERSLGRYRKKYIRCYEVCEYALKNIEKIINSIGKTA